MSLFNNDFLARIGDSIFILISPIRLIHIVVSALFLFIWIESFLVLLNIILIPIVLIIVLISIIQYKSRLTYGFVIAIVIFSIIRQIRFLPYYVNQYRIEQSGGIMECSCFPLGEIHFLLKMLAICLMVISLMHNRRMVVIYSWNQRFFGMAIVVGILLYGAIYLL